LRAFGHRFGAAYFCGGKAVLTPSNKFILNSPPNFPGPIRVHQYTGENTLEILYKFTAGEFHHQIKDIFMIIGPMDFSNADLKRRGSYGGKILMHRSASEHFCTNALLVVTWNVYIKSVPQKCICINTFVQDCGEWKAWGAIWGATGVKKVGKQLSGCQTPYGAILAPCKHNIGRTRFQRSQSMCTLTESAGNGSVQL
jgi:hypothetical protein